MSQEKALADSGSAPSSATASPGPRQTQEPRVPIWVPVVVVALIALAGGIVYFIVRPSPEHALIATSVPASNGTASIEAASNGATPDPTSTAPNSAPTALRLPCTNRRFSAIAGQTEPGEATPEEAALKEAQQRMPNTTVTLIGDDPNGQRFAVLDSADTVVAEIVVADKGNGWIFYSIETCR
jgi:hypothetical protein